MTLYRQLLILILVLVVMAFAGTLAVKVNSTRAFLSEQLASHAQDTATSLGLSMTPHMGDEDLAMLNVMVDAVFDRGYYRRIKVVRADGTALVDRSIEVRIDGVPAWFVNLLPLETPARSGTLMAGWRQAGSVAVESHPGYAYLELWQTCTHMLAWFAVVFVGAGFLGFLGLRLLLRPLQAVEAQAEAICNRRYPVQNTIPRTRELRRVVEAMNRMVEKVRATFDEQARTAEKFREQAFVDPVTGLGNRAYLQGELHNLLLPDRDAASGSLALIELENLALFNDEFGYEAGDRLLCQFTDVLRERARESDPALVARIGGGSFALVLPGRGTARAGEEVEALLAGLQGEYFERRNLGDMTFVGVAGYRPGMASGELLSRADTALRAAQASGDPHWALFEPERGPEAGLSRSEWRERLEAAFANRDLVFHLQAVMSTDGAVTLHHEVLARLRQGDEIWPAGKFMPMVRELRLAAAMDGTVLERLLPRLPGLEGKTLAVNLSPELLASREDLEGIVERIRPLGDGASRLVFEFSERGALRHYDNLRWFAEKVQNRGQGIAIDHFGRSLQGFGYLHSLRPAYVKIDGAYVAGVTKDPDSRFFIGTLCSALHSIDIQVIAESVETGSQRAALADLRVDGVQGFAVAMPVPMEEVAE